MVKEENVQQQLFAHPDNDQYAWKSIQQITRGSIIVVQQQETKVSNIKQSGNDWIVTFADPTTGEKTEQIYSDHDSLYAKS